MRERKVVKFRVDMYDDTKFKIIDMKPERDLIHYIWTRFVTLAGKVNLEGDLYMSKNIPYTIETLAIEFNRGTYQVELALDVLMKLEMIELTENKVYRVKNFAKHQNIKVKEKNKSTDKEENIKIKETVVKEPSKSKIYDNKDKESENKISQNEKREDKDIKNVKIIISDERNNLGITYENTNKVDNSISDDKINNNLLGSIPILLETKKNKRVNKRKKKEMNVQVSDEDVDDIQDVGDSEIVYFHDADERRTLGEGERVVME